MFAEYHDPDECRMVVICRTLEYFRSRREYSEIEETAFQESLFEVIRSLKEEGFEIPFTWIKAEERYKEAHECFLKLLAEGALIENRLGVYVYYVDPENRTEEDGWHKIQAHFSRIEGGENKKLHSAANRGYERYKSLISR